MNIVILDGHAINPGDLSWDALLSLGNLTVLDRTQESEIVIRVYDAEAVLTTRVSLSARTLEQLQVLSAVFVGIRLDRRAGRSTTADPRRNHSVDASTSEPFWEEKQ
jgi:hypothetical protein